MDPEVLNTSHGIAVTLMGKLVDCKSRDHARNLMFNKDTNTHAEWACQKIHDA